MQQVRRHLRLVVIGVVVVLVVAMGGIAWQFVHVDPGQQFYEIPEASLIYPDSVVLRSGGHPATSEADAEHWTQLGSSASVGEIERFFKSELAGKPWIAGGGSSGILGTHDRGVCVWHNDHVILRIGFWIPKKFQAQYPTDPVYATVYDIRIIDQTHPFVAPDPCRDLPG